MSSEKMKRFMEEVWGKQQGLTLKEMTYFITLACKDLPRSSIEKVTKLVLRTCVKRGVFKRSGRRYKILDKHRVRVIRELCPGRKRVRRCRRACRDPSGPFTTRHIIKRMRSVKALCRQRSDTHFTAGRRVGGARQRIRNFRRKCNVDHAPARRRAVRNRRRTSRASRVIGNVDQAPLWRNVGGTEQWASHASQMISNADHAPVRRRVGGAKMRTSPASWVLSSLDYAPAWRPVGGATHGIDSLDHAHSEDVQHFFDRNTDLEIKASVQSI